MKAIEPIQLKVLALHRTYVFVPEDKIKAFQNEMNKAKVDWQMILLCRCCVSLYPQRC